MKSLRQAALTKDEPVKTNYLGDFDRLESVRDRQDSLFPTSSSSRINPRDDWGYQGDNDIMPGMFKIRQLIPISKLGKAGDYDDPNFDYDKMHAKAEDMARCKVEDELELDLGSDFEVVKMSSTEQLDDIEVDILIKKAF